MDRKGLAWLAHGGDNSMAHLLLSALIGGINLSVVTRAPRWRALALAPTRLFGRRESSARHADIAHPRRMRSAKPQPHADVVKSRDRAIRVLAQIPADDTGHAFKACHACLMIFGVGSLAGWAPDRTGVGSRFRCAFGKLRQQWAHDHKKFIARSGECTRILGRRCQIETGPSARPVEHHSFAHVALTLILCRDIVRIVNMTPAIIRLRERLFPLPRANMVVAFCSSRLQHGLTARDGECLLRR